MWNWHVYHWNGMVKDGNFALTPPPPHGPIILDHMTFPPFFLIFLDSPVHCEYMYVVYTQGWSWLMDRVNAQYRHFTMVYHTHLIPYISRQSISPLIFGHIFVIYSSFAIEWYRLYMELTYISSGRWVWRMNFPSHSATTSCPIHRHILSHPWIFCIYSDSTAHLQ